MLYYLFAHLLRPYFSPLNVFRYITVRTAVANAFGLQGNNTSLVLMAA